MSRFSTPHGRMFVAATVCLLCAGQAATAGSCTADINDDGNVNVDDLLALLGEWGDCNACASDLDGDGSVNVDDLLQLLQEFGQPCDAIVSMELAGGTRSDYPHFAYHTTFNQGSTISAAIDPVRHPDLVGVTGDLYLVNAKTMDDWDNDPQLNDVTSGGSQSWTIVAGSVTDNIVSISGSNALNGDGGTTLGIAYDVVFDINQNGILDGSDLIDGYNPPAPGRGSVHGCYVVDDLTQTGPLAVTELTYNIPNWTGTAGYQQENLFYPTAVSGLSNLPVVIVSRGNGHNYQWYDHIGVHLASHGYVVMSHNNHTEPGIETASETTLLHTDLFLGQLDAVGGGVLDGKVDRSRIIWIGHSRGGEGVVRAYDRLTDGDYLPDNYSINDIILVSSIAPTDFLSTGVTDPHGVPYHLWTGGSDADVNGCADCNICQTFHLHDRAEQFRQSISLHGAGHGDFHNGGGSSVATGPCLIGRSATHQIMRGYILPLFDHYARGSVPARDFLWRQWESFRPIGGPNSTCINVDLMYREGDVSTAFVVDDFQTEETFGTSSSGGSVTSSLLVSVEDKFDDGNSTFSNDGNDPMNGMTVGAASDDTRGLVVAWTNDRFLEFEIVEGARDRSAAEYLSFRACQTTRHPNTTAQLGDLTFSVTLRDGSGQSSTINIGAYGGGIEEPYQRTSCGSGAGWANEFETIRMRVADFGRDSTIDLSDLVAVRFEFGPSYGSNIGRIGLDDIQFVTDVGPPIPGSIQIRVASALPELVAPNTDYDIDLNVSGSREDVVAGTVVIRYRYDDGAFLSATGTNLLGDLYRVTLPGAPCGSMPEFYFEAEGTESGVVSLPETAPAEVYASEIGVIEASFLDDFETNMGWVAENLGASSGDWQRGVPVNDPGWEYDPATDGDGSGQCYLTQNVLGNTDVDNGAVRLTSPTFNWPSGQGYSLNYDYYLLLTNSGAEDMLLVELSDDGGSTWVTAVIHDESGGTEWRAHEISEIDLASLGLSAGSNMRMRVTANDTSPQSIVEAGLDGVQCSRVGCN